MSIEKQRRFGIRYCLHIYIYIYIYIYRERERERERVYVVREEWVPENLFKLGSILLRNVGKYSYSRRFKLTNVLYILVSARNRKLQHRPAICSSHRTFISLMNTYK